MTLPKSSVSDINLFLSEPSLWFIKHMRDMRAEAGPAAKRGSSVEHGLNMMLLHGLSLEQGVAEAQGYFREQTAGEITDAIEAEFARLAPLLAQAQILFKRYEKPPFQLQRRVEEELDGLLLVGYIDYKYDAFLVDLKTTKALPSVARDRDVRQMAFYQHADKVKPHLAYVTDKRGVIHEPSQGLLDDGLAQLRMGARAIERIWRGRDDWDRWLPLFPPREMSSYLWDDATRLLAKELWS